MWNLQLILRIQHKFNYNAWLQEKKNEKKKEIRFPYVSLNWFSLLFWMAISLCIFTFSVKSDRKLSKQSFSSCKHLLYMKYFAIRSVWFKEHLCFVLSKVPYEIILFDNMMFSLVLLAPQFRNKLQKDTVKEQCKRRLVMMCKLWEWDELPNVRLVLSRRQTCWKQSFTPIL